MTLGNDRQGDRPAAERDRLAAGGGERGEPGTGRGSAADAGITEYIRFAGRLPRTANGYLPLDISDAEWHALSGSIAGGHPEPHCPTCNCYAAAHYPDPATDTYGAGPADASAYPDDSTASNTSTVTDS